MCACVWLSLFQYFWWTLWLCVSLSLAMPLPAYRVTATRFSGFSDGASHSISSVSPVVRGALSLGLWLFWAVSWLYVRLYL